MTGTTTINVLKNIPSEAKFILKLISTWHGCTASTQSPNNQDTISVCMNVWEYRYPPHGFHKCRCRCKNWSTKQFSAFVNHFVFLCLFFVLIDVLIDVAVVSEPQFPSLKRLEVLGMPEIIQLSYFLQNSCTYQSWISVAFELPIWYYWVLLSIKCCQTSFFLCFAFFQEQK